MKVIILKQTFHFNKGEIYTLSDFLYISGRNLDWIKSYPETYLLY